jgi:uncharacterized membrane protein YkvA (DUF1232 family)
MSKTKRQPPDPDLLDRLWSDIGIAIRLLFDRRMSLAARLIPLAMVAYILSPIDLMPDFLLPFGVVDDLSAFLIGLQLFLRSAPPGVVDQYRHRGKRKRSEVVDRHPQIIEGDYELRDKRE